MIQPALRLMVKTNIATNFLVLVFALAPELQHPMALAGQQHCSHRTFE